MTVEPFVAFPSAGGYRTRYAFCRLRHQELLASVRFASSRP
ncbi:MAG: hypothetical protein ABR593_04600 [Candidatus Limnocylindria bacterium]